MTNLIPPLQKKYLPFLLFLFVMISGLIGSLFIYNARVLEEEPMHFVLRQLCWSGIGALLFAGTASIPFRLYRKTTGCLAGSMAFLLILVLFTGQEVNHMRGWFGIPGLFMIQPSEFAKCFFLLFLCRIAGTEERLSAKKFVLMLFITLGFMFLLMLEPDYGGAIMFFAAFLFAAWGQGAKPRYFVIAFLILAVCTLLFVLKNEYAFQRITAYFDPLNAANAKTWHIQQFQYTLAHGGWTGSPNGSSLWSRAFLPLPHTDSLFASITESTGFIGAVLVILAFAGLGTGFTVISWRTRDPMGRLYVFGIGMLCFFQALVHISVNCVLLPPTGVTLPMLSYGGSSLLSVMTGFGIAFSAASEKQE